MSQLKDICRFISLVEEMTEELEEKKKPKKQKEIKSLLDSFYPSVEAVNDRFKEKYKCGRSRATGTYQDAKDGKYIDTMPKLGDTKYKVPHYVYVKTSGRTLNSKDFGMPTGRWNAWLSGNSALVNFLGGGVVASLLGGLIWFIRVYLV